jgi:hypothetical protein
LTHDKLGSDGASGLARIAKGQAVQWHFGERVEAIHTSMLVEMIQLDHFTLNHCGFKDTMETDDEEHSVQLSIKFKSHSALLEVANGCLHSCDLFVHHLNSFCVFS